LDQLNISRISGIRLYRISRWVIWYPAGYRKGWIIRYPAGYRKGRIIRPDIRLAGYPVSSECIPIVYYDTACIKIRKKNQGSNAEEIKISRNNHNTGTGNLKVKRKALMA
jgi:hypothetical protein